MLVCPVCKYSHQKEVEKCQRCNWSMQDNLDINIEHPVLQICVSSLVRKIEEEVKINKNLRSMIQQPEVKDSDSRKLDEIIDELDKDRKEIKQQFASLSEQIDRLRTPLIENKAAESTEFESNLKESKSVSSNAEVNKKTDSYSDNSSDRQDIEQKTSSKHLVESDRNLSSDSSLSNEILQDSTNQKSINHESSIDSISNENNEIKSECNNYQNFYTLIDKKELNYINVAIPKETLEQSRSGTQSQLKFTEDRKGSYWIVDWKNTYCLIPKKNININQYQYGNFQRVFNCSDYREDYINFELIEPATITNSDGETWQLGRKGKIKFT